MHKLLFVCDGNEQRSPTFENWFEENRPQQYKVRSAGISAGHPYQITDRNVHKTLYWADRVFCMDMEQFRYLWERYPSTRDKIEVIGISDNYGRGENRLLHLVEFWAERRDL